MYRKQYVWSGALTGVKLGGKTIPNDPRNKDWKEYQTHVQAGGQALDRFDTDEQVAAYYKNHMDYKRRGLLQDVIWMRDRHRDQLDLGTPTTLTEQQFTELLTYIQALRDVPVVSDPLGVPIWPSLPSFLQ